jgi:hypothetical protein
MSEKTLYGKLEIHLERLKPLVKTHPEVNLLIEQIEDALSFLYTGTSNRLTLQSLKNYCDTLNEPSKDIKEVSLFLDLLKNEELKVIEECEENTARINRIFR